MSLGTRLRECDGCFPGQQCAFAGMMGLRQASAPRNPPDCRFHKAA